MTDNDKTPGAILLLYAEQLWEIAESDPKTPEIREYIADHLAHFIDPFLDRTYNTIH